MGVLAMLAAEAAVAADLFDGHGGFLTAANPGLAAWR
jgi:hypothetical protein